MEYYINFKRAKRNTAGSKAPNDIAYLCEKRGMKCFEVPPFPSGKNKIYKKIWLMTVNTGWWMKFEKVLKDGDVVVYQHPLYGHRIAARMIKRIKKKKNCKFIVVIHDLESLRRGIAGVINDNKKTNEFADNILLKQFDKVICHNEVMKKYLIEQGFEKERLVSLDIFDYLSDCERKQEQKGDEPSVAIAGNLAQSKCGYIYDIIPDDKSCNQNLKVNLYGMNYENTYKNDNVIYHGSFKPEELAGHIRGDFGLVWDGISATTCEGNTGNYLRYNNPHKTSMYLSAGMPVVVWKEAAIAEFVIKNKVGIVIDSLYELEDKIKLITIDEYDNICENVNRVSKLLREGHFFNEALRKCLD